jgi:hypothetical protein
MMTMASGFALPIRLRLKRLPERVRALPASPSLKQGEVVALRLA